MEEKIIVRGERADVKKIFTIFLIIGIALSVLTFAFTLKNYSDAYESHNTHDYYCYKPEYRGQYYQDTMNYGTKYLPTYKLECSHAYYYKSGFVYALNNVEGADLLKALIPLLLMAAIGGLLYLSRRNCELAVTNKRILGIPSWSKKVAIPLESVTVTCTHGTRKLVISSYAKNYTFHALTNADELYKTINHLLIEKQAQKYAPVVAAPVAPAPEQTASSTATTKRSLFKKKK